MVSIAIVGSGFGGVGMAARLLQDGHTDLVLFERSDDLGGVWRDNTYPGAACDVPSHLYSFSFAPEGGWSRRFAPQAEIHAYLRRVADEFGVTPRVRFGTEVLSATWDDDARVWDLALSGGRTHRCDVLIAACGQLGRPADPHLPGLEDFTGTVFHSGAWDHGHDLTGRRVAVVGTGASAIQFLPEVREQAEHVTLFQRSAPYVIRKPDRAYGPRTHAALQHVPGLLKADRLRTFVVNELRSLGFNSSPALMRVPQKSFARHLAKQVADPGLRERLTPDYTIGCKRILQSNDWYPALTRPDVDVVTEAVTQMDATGLTDAAGVRHEVDTIVLGTGFAATELLLPMTVTGRGGRAMAQAWSEGAEAYLGTLVSGFPNLFLLYGPNTNLGHNSIILMLEGQYALIRDGLRQLAGGLASIDVRSDVLREFNDELQDRLSGTVFAEGCTSWYLTASGRNTQNWPGTTLDFRRRTRKLDPAVLEPVRVHT